MSSAESLSRKWAGLFGIMVLLGQLEENSAFSVLGQTVDRYWETMVVCPTFFLSQKAQNWIQHLRCGITSLSDVVSCNQSPQQRPWKTGDHLFRLVPAMLLSLDDCCCEELTALCCEWCSRWDFLPDLWLQLGSSLPDDLQPVHVMDLLLP